MTAEFAFVAVLLLAAGAVTGVLAGLFGVGGGALIVPVLYEVFGVTGVPDDLRMPLAVGTSLAIIIPTSIRSFMGHRARGAVDEALLKSWALPILAGVLIGAALARFAPAYVFQLVFVVVAGVNAFKMIFGIKAWNLGADLPKGGALYSYGGVIGLLSALMGIGGGQISNLIMTLHGRPIHQAVATSAGIGVLISVPGAIGYMISGFGRAGLPVDAIGFVSFLGMALFVPTTILTANLGVKLAHSLSRRHLELAFGVFLALVSLRFIYAIITG
ncbi:sulfite exporter TauE/SafE family protein [Rhodobacteraceae bacterium XHP0102]|nr:sulfite exporter TauE/SafE family protein [Rhodobacteraceae bacterium XHP0102]